MSVKVHNRYVSLPNYFKFTFWYINFGVIPHLIRLFHRKSGTLRDIMCQITSLLQPAVVLAM